MILFDEIYILFEKIALSFHKNVNLLLKTCDDHYHDITR